MSEDIRQKAVSALKEVDKVNEVILPEPKADLIDVSKAKAADKKAIKDRMVEIDIANTQSIIEFGSKAQSGMQAISHEMLSGVRSKDTGPAGDSLRAMVTSLRGFSVDELNPNRQQSWWEKLLGRAKPVAEFMARYETVQTQIDDITGELLDHEHTLLKDIKSLDKLYGKTLSFYDELALYIAAGTAKLEELDEITIPAKADDLERRVHDLRLTRQVTMQSLPSIRLVQENDKSLVTKINSTLVNTVPLWETQLAQAVTIHRSREAAGVVRAATDLTNELLEANAENLKAANREVREEMERGVFDIESIKRANQNLLDTIEESLRIADAGKAKRAEAEKELEVLEEKLKQTLAAAKAKETGIGETIGQSAG
jgi:uncharacterized protein YaaN involved in tellurite resistance